MKIAVTCLLALGLLICHQDYWQWERNEIVFGFLPYTMAYNIGISLATAGMWVLVCTLLWPKGLDESSVEKEGGDK